MKKRLVVMLLAGAMLLHPGTAAMAAEKESKVLFGQELFGELEEVQDKLKEALENTDKETTDEIFAFLKEKGEEGNLSSEEGIKEVIAEGMDKFDVTISEEDIKAAVEVMSRLEDMGFDAAGVINKAESLYQEYGTDFVDHTSELVLDTVKQSAGNVVKKSVGGFFTGLWKSVKGFFADLF